MKRLLIIFSFFLCTVVQAQNYVFVLVDVSKSVSQNQLTDSKQALYEVLTGSNLSKAFITQGKPQDLGNFKLVQGDKLAITKFGSLQTTLAIAPNPIQIQNVGVDVNQALNSILWAPTDNQTYITLAKAKIAEYAKNHQIGKYKLYIISDNIQDDYGQGGKPNYPDDYTRNLAEGYNTSTNQVNEAGYTKIKFSANSLFTLSFSPNVDVSKYSLPGGTLPVIIDTTDTNASITISSPTEGKKNKEVELKDENINISWTCTNCPQGIKYNVRISGYDGGKFREMKKDLLTPSAKFKVPDGKYKITVSAQNYPANSDTTFVKVTTGNPGLIIFILFLLVAMGVGYHFWNIKRQEKINMFAADKASDLFSGNSNGGSSGNSSSNSDYL